MGVGSGGRDSGRAGETVWSRDIGMGGWGSRDSGIAGDVVWGRGIY